MNVIGNTKSLTDIDAQAVAVAIFKGEKADSGLLKNLNAAIGGNIAEAIHSEEFTGKEHETAYFHVNSGKLKFKRLLLVGCGLNGSGLLLRVAGRGLRLLELLLGLLPGLLVLLQLLRELLDLLLLGGNCIFQGLNVCHSSGGLRRRRCGRTSLPRALAGLGPYASRQCGERQGSE